MTWLREATFGARVRYHQVRRFLRWLRDRRSFARARIADAALADYPAQVAWHSSTLIRDPGRAKQDLQYGKVSNLRIAADRLDRLLIRPGEVFSFWFTVGPPTRRRGFQDGLELRNRQLIPSAGGGLCQLSNLLYWMALHADLQIIEHHRHGYDLFPDNQRRLPFASGATVFYNYRDLQFRNSLDLPIVLRVRVGTEDLEGCFLAPHRLPFAVHLYETDHRFYEQAGRVWRTNRLWKRVTDGGGAVRRHDLVAHNVCEVLYPVSPDLLAGARVLPAAMRVRSLT